MQIFRSRRKNGGHKQTRMKTQKSDDKKKHSIKDKGDIWLWNEKASEIKDIRTVELRRKGEHWEEVERIGFLSNRISNESTDGFDDQVWGLQVVGQAKERKQTWKEKRTGI